MYGSVGASNCKLFILNLTINRLVALHPNSSTDYLPYASWKEEEILAGDFKNAK